MYVCFYCRHTHKTLGFNCMPAYVLWRNQFTVVERSQESASVSFPSRFKKKNCLLPSCPYFPLSTRSHYKKTKKKLLSSLTLSTLYCCNSTPILPSSSSNRLEKFQNNYSRLALHNTKIWLCYSSFEEALLAPWWGEYPLQNWHTCFEALWEFSPSFLFSITS